MSTTENDIQVLDKVGAIAKKSYRTSKALTSPAFFASSLIADKAIDTTPKKKPPKVNYSAYSIDAKKLIDRNKLRKKVSNHVKFDVKKGSQSDTKEYLHDVRNLSFQNKLTSKKLIKAQQLEVKKAGEDLKKFKAKVGKIDSARNNIREIKNNVEDSIIDSFGNYTDVNGREESITQEVDAIRSTFRIGKKSVGNLGKSSAEFIFGRKERVAKRDLKKLRKELKREKKDLILENKLSERNRLAKMSPEEQIIEKKRLQKKRLRRRFSKYRYGVRSSYRNAIQTFKSTPQNIKSALKDFLKQSVKKLGNTLIKLSIGSLFVLIFILIFILIILFSAGGSSETHVEATYPTEESEMLAAEKYFNDKELNLSKNSSLSKVKEKYPGYDDYSINVPSFKHSKYDLQSYLNAEYGQYKASDIHSKLDEIFKKMYKVETRVENYQTLEGEPPRYVTKRRLVYTVTEKDMDTISREYLSSDIKKLNYYDLYKKGFGQHPEMFDGPNTGLDNEYKYHYEDGKIDPYDARWASVYDSATSNPIATALFNAGASHLGDPYVWGGSKPGGFDCSGFVEYTINQSGLTHIQGRLSANALRLKYTTFVTPLNAMPGDLIFFQGTYATVGASHVGIFLGNGYMMHAGNPVKISKINTPFWQAHFLQYGRLKIG